MKLKFIKLCVITLLLLLTGAGCKDNEPMETNPAQIILGKWELIEAGGILYEANGDYKEYLPDSILREYDNKTGNIGIAKYWIDTLLHENFYATDESYLPVRFEYLFTNKNHKMHLKFINIIGTYKDLTYQRIK